jgi:hypothetical protein
MDPMATGKTEGAEKFVRGKKKAKKKSDLSHVCFVFSLFLTYFTSSCLLSSLFPLVMDGCVF